MKSAPRPVRHSTAMCSNDTNHMCFDRPTHQASVIIECRPVSDRRLSPWQQRCRGVVPYDADSAAGVPVAAPAAKRRSRKLLDTTKTELNAIAAPAIMGLSSPAAASGIAATL